EYDGVIEHGRAAIRLDPQNVRYRDYLVIALFRLRRFGDVVEETKTWNEKVRCASHEREAAFALGRSYAEVNEFKQALSWYATLEQTEEILYHQGCAQAHLSMHEAALE